LIKVGGVSGPLYGNLLMAMAKTAPEVPVNPADLAAVLEPVATPA
jgi:hypothetical protein